MAQPIPLNLPPRDPRKELLDRLERAPQEHAEALLDGYDLLEQLRQSGILQLLRGTLSAGDEILERVAGAATSPQGTRALRNLLILGQMLSAIDPDLLECFAVAAGQTLGSERKTDIEPPGVFALLSEFRQPELRRSVAFLNKFLGALGAQLKNAGSTRPQS